MEVRPTQAGGKLASISAAGWNAFISIILRHVTPQIVVGSDGDGRQIPDSKEAKKQLAWGITALKECLPTFATGQPKSFLLASFGPREAKKCGTRRIRRVQTDRQKCTRQASSRKYISPSIDEAFQGSVQLMDLSDQLGSVQFSAIERSLFFSRNEMRTCVGR